MIKFEKKLKNTLMKKIAVMLSGCGVYDGSEIHEAVLTMLAIKKNQADYDIFAPNIKQHHVINHLSGDVMIDEIRNVLIESARIARGNIKDIDKFLPEYYDAIVFPGGYGAAKNLSSFAFEGAYCDVNQDIERAINRMHDMKKPIGALCIAPAIISRVIENIEVTIGKDENALSQIEKMGSKHKITTHGEVVVDLKNKIVTTPCYMLDADILQIAEGADNLIKEVLKLC